MPEKQTEQSIPAMTPEQLTENLFVLKQMLDTLNIAIAGVAYAADIDTKALDTVKAEDYLTWIEAELHPLVRRTNDLHREIAKKTAKETKQIAKKATKKAKKEKK